MKDCKDKFCDMFDSNLGVACIVFAAGGGRRYGTPKWKAVFKGQTFLEIVVEKIKKAADVDKIICVIRKNSNPNIKNVELVVSPNPELGMFSSLSVGIKQVPDALGYLIVPVDHPFFEPETIRRLCSAFKENECKKIIRPVFDDKPGHPILIPGFLGQNIPPGDYKGGLKQFIIDTDIPQINVVVNDPGILRNINTKAML